MRHYSARLFLALILAATAAPAQDKMPPLKPLKGTPAPSPPADPDHFVFVVAGDNRPKDPSITPTDTVKQIFQDIAKEAPAFVLWSGDIISGKDPSGPISQEYQAFLAVAASGGAAVYNAPGNHEMNNHENCPSDKMLKYYLDDTGQDAPYGWFDYGNSRFIALDTDEATPSGDKCNCSLFTGEDKPPGYISKHQIDLLKEELDDAKEAKKAHIFLFMHRPIKGYNKKDQLCEENVTKLKKMFEDYPNLSFVVAGHQHMYYNDEGKGDDRFCAPPERTDPGKKPFYLVSGGAGAPLKGNKGGFFHYLIFTVDKDKVSVKLVPLDKKYECK